MGGCDALKARRRAKLLREDPHCWYCGRGVFWDESRGGQSKMLPDTAVIESELSRNETGTQPKGARTYLSCYECADERAKYENTIFRMWTNEYWARWREENGYPVDRPTNKQRRIDNKLPGPDPHLEGILIDGC
jgi:hypothetical protein